MRRLMLAERWRSENSYYFGLHWRAAVAVGALYLIARML
jgi:hypothetical protein